MIYLIPMAGAGSRFAEQGYKDHKPEIPTTSWRSGCTVPMVVAAIEDLPNLTKESEIILIDRDFHKQSGLEQRIGQYYPKAAFITIDQLTQGQASSCLLAQDLINNDQELLIAGCDNGMIFDQAAFNLARQKADVIIFTYRNHRAVLEKPSAYGWVKVDELGNVAGVSVKQPISNTPMNDHAIVATFWFKKGRYFVQAAQKMIAENDRINNEFYVDQVMTHALDLGLKVRVFEIEKYLGWGTPADYEEYENTYKYWKNFSQSQKIGR